MLKSKRILGLTEASQALNMTEDQILYLVRTRGIPHRVEEDGRLTFTEWEIKARIIPAPSSEAMPRPKIDVSNMTKDEIMEVFSSILQQKAAQDSKALEESPKEEEEEEEGEPLDPSYPEPRNETPATPPKKTAPAKTKTKTAEKPKK